MVNVLNWTDDELTKVVALSTAAFVHRYPHRTANAVRSQRNRLVQAGITAPPTGREILPLFTSDKKVGTFTWREANQAIAGMQHLKQQASSSQDTATIVFDVDHPLAFICLSDTHIGSLASDHARFEQITDEILSTPNLYLAVLGDLQNMAIKMRNVLEVSDDALAPDLQHRYIESWLDEMAPRILFSTWDNHSVMREEAQAGSSRYADLMRRRVIWHNGIGHPNIQVGGETYKIAASHFFRGRSIENPCHAQMRYARREGQDREIIIAGDSHVPGLVRYVDGVTPRLAVNAGTLHLNSGYGRRFFGLFAQPVFPVVELWPDRHRFVGHWNLEEMRSFRG